MADIKFMQDNAARTGKAQYYTVIVQPDGKYSEAFGSSSSLDINAEAISKIGEQSLKFFEPKEKVRLSETARKIFEELERKGL